MIKRFFQRHSEYISDIAIVFLLTLILLGFLFHNFFTNPFYYLSADIAELYFPWWVYINSAVHSLHVPFINRFWFGGSLPFAALESSFFYPPYIIIQYFFDAEKNLNTAYFFHFATELGHYVFAALSFYVLARFGLKLGRFSSIFSAVIYATSGVFIGRFIHTVVILTLAWLPSLYLSYFEFLRTKKPVYLLGVVVSLTMIVTSGHPQMVYYVYALFGLAVLYFTLMQPRREWIKTIGASVAAIVISILLTAFKFLLTFELAGNIVRTTSETTIANLYNSLHPMYYLTMLVPYLFGKHYVGYWGSDYPWGNWENFIYIGIIPVIFLAFSLFHRKRKWMIFFVGNLFLIFFLMLGKYNSLSAFINTHSPLAQSMTMISKMTNFFHFFLIIVVAYGIDAAQEIREKKAMLLSFALLVVFAATVLLTVNPKTASYFHFENRQPPREGALQFIAGNILQAKFLFLISLLGILFFLRSQKEAAGMVLVSIYALDIFLSAGNFNPIEASPGPPELYFGKTAIINELKADNTLYRVDNLWPRNVNMIQGIESTYGYHTIETRSYREMMALFNFQNRAVVDMMNVKYVISDKNLAEQDDFRQIQPNLWQNMRALDRVSFVPRVRIVENREQMVSSLIDKNFDPRKEVIVYNDAKHIPFEKSSAHEESAKVDVKSYSGDTIRLKVENNQPGYLFFSQFQYPGWYAVVDGKRQDLLMANLSFYALPLEQGDHTVQFAFSSKPFVQGLIISGVTIILVILSFLFPKTRSFYFIPLIKAHGKRK